MHFSSIFMLGRSMGRLKLKELSWEGNVWEKCPRGISKRNVQRKCPRPAVLNLLRLADHLGYFVSVRRPSKRYIYTTKLSNERFSFRPTPRPIFLFILRPRCFLVFQMTDILKISPFPCMCFL